MHPELGTLEDFRRLVAAAREHGLEIALDFAIQCSPDHPWLKQHPEWFALASRRHDALRRESAEEVRGHRQRRFLCRRTRCPTCGSRCATSSCSGSTQGVRIFRVDNPHTKPLPFWEWMIGDMRGRHPDAIFLAEAFTRPKMMYRLAQDRLLAVLHLLHVAQHQARVHRVPDASSRTTDVARILSGRTSSSTRRTSIPFFLQTSGRAGFLIRAALAATLVGPVGRV